MPFLSTDEWAGRVCREAFRILKLDGTVHFSSETGGAHGWIPWLRLAGFVNVEAVKSYAVGTKH